MMLGIANLLAEISVRGGSGGEGALNQLLFVLIIGICFLVVWWMGRYAITALAAPPIVMTVWNGLFILLGGICVINFLLSLVDRPFIRW